MRAIQVSVNTILVLLMNIVDLTVTLIDVWEMLDPQKNLTKINSLIYVACLIVNSFYCKIDLTYHNKFTFIRRLCAFITPEL